jgi:tetratricopeptide (TPR) repeat protein
MGPYALWEKENVKITWEYSNPKYDYHNQPYYRAAIPKDWDITKKRERSYYRIPPYLDKIGDQEIIFVTLSTLMYDSEGKLLGLTTVDWSFEDLNKLLGQFDITKNSYTTLIDLPNSKIVFYPDKKLIMQDKSILKWTQKIEYEKLEKNKITKMESEFIEGIEHDIYYTVTNSDYLLAAIINKKEAYAVIGGIVARNVLLSVVTLALVGFFIFIVVDLSIKPLNKIITVLRGIASGSLDLKERININSTDEFGELADTFNNMADKIESQNQEIKEYSETLEDKVIQRTDELNQTLQEVTKLKKQQDGDYFLTSLLLEPLGKVDVNSENLNVNFYVKQKKTFEFKNQVKAIGGDLCIANSIQLKERDYTIFLNCDAMGKSIQGAGGALILGSVFGAIIERTRSTKLMQAQSPEKWIKGAFIELHKTFETFDGSMLVSMVMGLVDNKTGLLYFINAEHPWTVLYRDEKASFVETEFMFHKLGMGGGTHNTIYVRTFQMLAGDVIIVGSDGRDDLIIGKEEISGQRIINEDENEFLRRVEEGDGDLKKIASAIENVGELTDDFSLLRIEFKSPDSISSIETSSIPVLEAIKKGRMLEKKGKHADALIEFRAAYNIEPQNPILLRDLIKVSLYLKHYAQTIEYAKSYINLRPIDTEIIFALSYAYKRNNQRMEAIELGEQIRLREPKNVKYLTHLIELYIGVDTKRANSLLGEVMKVDPENEKLLSLQESLRSLG